jgi:hypothetical protein
MCRFVVQKDPATGITGTVTQPRKDVMVLVAVVLFLHLFRMASSTPPPSYILASRFLLTGGALKYFTEWLANSFANPT